MIKGKRVVLCVTGSIAAFKAADLASKKTFLEDNGQFPRKVTIA